MVALADSAVIDETLVPREFQMTPGPVQKVETHPRSESLREQLEAVERRIIQEALASCRNNRSQAARLLKIGRTTLLDRMRKLGLTPRFPL